MNHAAVRTPATTEELFDDDVFGHAMSRLGEGGQGVLPDTVAFDVHGRVD